MYFTSIFASTLLAAVSAATIQQQQPSNMAARQLQGNTCTINMEQFKESHDDLQDRGHFSGDALDVDGETVGSFDLQFEGGGYPVVLRQFPEFLLVVKADHDDVAPLFFEYLGQKWTSDETEHCTQGEYSGESRNISCTFQC